jgi:hypothetical protein
VDYKVLVGKPEGDHFEDIGIDGNVILKLSGVD